MPVKNRSGKCEGPEGLGGGVRRVKEPKWEMRRTWGGGVDEVKNRSGQWEGPGGGGGARRVHYAPGTHVKVMEWFVY